VNGVTWSIMGTTCLGVRTLWWCYDVHGRSEVGGGARGGLCFRDRLASAALNASIIRGLLVFDGEVGVDVYVGGDEWVLGGS
jgi:hypothetical protein